MRMLREREEKEKLPFKPQLVTLQSERRAWDTIDVPEAARKATIQHSPVVNQKERFESLFQDSERRKKSAEKKQQIKDQEISDMHKKTI